MYATFYLKTMIFAFTVTFQLKKIKLAVIVYLHFCESNVS